MRLIRNSAKPFCRRRSVCRRKGGGTTRERNRLPARDALHSAIVERQRIRAIPASIQALVSGLSRRGMPDQSTKAAAKGKLA